MLSYKQVSKNLKGLKSYKVCSLTSQKPKTTNKKISRKSSNNTELSNMSLNNTWIKKKVTKETRKYFKQKENANTIYKNLRYS